MHAERLSLSGSPALVPARIGSTIRSRTSASEALADERPDRDIGATEGAGEHEIGKGSKLPLERQQLGAEDRTRSKRGPPSRCRGKAFRAVGRPHERAEHGGRMQLAVDPEVLAQSEDDVVARQEGIGTGSRS